MQRRRRNHRKQQAKSKGGTIIRCELLPQRGAEVVEARHNGSGKIAIDLSCLRIRVDHVAPEGITNSGV